MDKNVRGLFHQAHGTIAHLDLALAVHVIRDFLRRLLEDGKINKFALPIFLLDFKWDVGADGVKKN
jgi:hypothetical protein